MKKAFYKIKKIENEWMQARMRMRSMEKPNSNTRNSGGKQKVVPGCLHEAQLEGSRLKLRPSVGADGKCEAKALREKLGSKGHVLVKHHHIPEQRHGCLCISVCVYICKSIKSRWNEAFYT